MTKRREQSSKGAASQGLGAAGMAGARNGGYLKGRGVSWKINKKKKKI